MAGFCECGNENLDSVEDGKFVDQVIDIKILNKASTSWILLFAFVSNISCNISAAVDFQFFHT